MLLPRNRKKLTSNISVIKGPSSNKKPRKPLKCKKNVIHTSESRKNSLKKCESEEKNTHSEINQESLRSPKKILRSSPRINLSLPENTSISGKNMLKFIDPDFKAIHFVEIDVLANCTLSKRKTPAASEQDTKLPLSKAKHTDKNISKLKSQKNKKKLDKLSTDISPISQNSSPYKNKRHSFYRQSYSTTQHCKNPNRKMSLNDIYSKTTTPRSYELPEDSLRLRNSIVLRSTQKDKRTSNDRLLSYGLGMKRIRKKTKTPKNLPTVNSKETPSLSSKLKKASVQKNRERDLVLRGIEKPETDINCKLPDAVELHNNIDSSRRSMTLGTRHSSEKTLMQKNKDTDSTSRSIQKRNTNINDKTPEVVELFPSSSRRSLRLRTSSEETQVQKNKEINLNSSSIQKPKTNIKDKTPEAVELFASSSRSSMTLRTRHSSEKALENLSPDKVPNTDKIKKHSAISKEQKSKNVKSVKTRKKSISLANQETEMLVHKHKRSHSFPKCSLQSKNNDSFNNKDSQMQKMTPSKNTSGSRRKSLTLVSRKKSEKTSERNLKVKKIPVILSKAKKEAQIKKFAVSSKKKKAELKGKKNERKRLSSSLKLKTPIEKKRKLSVNFKKQVRPRSYSAHIPIDSLAITPALSRATKSDGFKFSGKNTLKRKRFVMDEIKKADIGYQDDIYESKTFDHFKDMFPDSSDSSEYSCLMKTPKLASVLTPAMHSKTPAYKDCFSPSEYALNRKIAEECIYRNRKKKRTSQVETPEVPEKKKLEFNAAVEKACAAQKEVEKLTLDSSDEEDSYFNDDI